VKRGFKKSRKARFLKTTQSAVCFFAAPAAKIWRHDISSASEGAFQGSFGDVFGYSSIPGNRNWQIETADWNLDIRLDI